MAERSTGVLVGGILALIGALIGLWAWIALSAQAAAASMNIVYFAVDITFGIIMSATTVAVGAVIPWLILIGAILVIIFAIMLIAGKAMRISAILVLIGGILSILAVAMALAAPMAILFLIGGILEFVGAILAMATGAW